MNKYVNSQDTLSYLEEYQTMLHYMFASDTWGPASRTNRKDIRVLSLLMYCQYLTIDLLVAAQVNQGTTSGATFQLLDRYIKRGLIKKDCKILIGSSYTDVYTLTTQGATYCREELPKFLKNQTFFDLSISNDCIEIMYHRFINQHAKKNMNHYIQLLYTVIYSITGHRLCYHDVEAFINQIGIVLTPADKLALAQNKSHQIVKVKSDVYLKYVYNNYTTELFVEQDMSTQRSNILANKMEAYCRYVHASCNGKSLQNLVFSLYRPYEIPSTTITPLHISHLRCAIACALHSNEFKKGIYKLETFPLERVCEILRQDIENIMNSKYMVDYKLFFISTEKIINDLLCNGEAKTISHLSWLLKERNIDRSSQVKQLEYDQILKGYISRKKAIFQAALANDEIVTSMKQGFSICTMPSKYASQYLSYFGYGMGKWDDGIRFAQASNPFICASEEVTNYEPLTDTLQADGYVLRNHFIYDTGEHVYVENISEDIGGYVRVQEYMQTLRFSGHEGTLLCLVNDEPDALSMAYQLWYNTNYVNALATKILPLEVAFVKYNKITEYESLFKTPFIFDDDGKIKHYL